jgi:hypothetical protein
MCGYDARGWRGDWTDRVGGALTARVGHNPELVVAPRSRPDQMT